jgi:hypothetical protein
MEANVDPSIPGSRLDADHPEKGVLLACLSTLDTDTKRRIAEWMRVQQARFDAVIPPTESDRAWFERQARKNPGRFWRVRPSVAADHWRFEILGEPTAGHITLITRDRFVRYVLAINTERFGEPVDLNGYAVMRVEALAAERKRAAA